MINKHQNDARVISFTYSHKEKRIGTTNNDYSISFWDFSDNFKYEKTFSTLQGKPDCQSIKLSQQC